MLTKIALLNALTGISEQFSRILLGLFVTPILITYFGSNTFGIWQVLLKVSNQLSALDGRAQEVLKWVVANLQHKEDKLKQQALGAAFLCFLLFVPILTGTNFLWIYYLPIYFELPEDQILPIRISATALFISILLLALAKIFDASVRGMNMSYKLFGVLALIILSGGIFTVVLVKQGYGIIGAGSAQILVGFLSLIAYSYVVKRHIKWFKVRLPPKKLFYTSLRRSCWFTLWGVINTWMLAGDVIVLGFFVGTELVSSYVLTVYAMQMITVAILTAISAALPGLGGIIGKGDFKRANYIRKESLLFSWWLSLTICCTVIVVNYSFIGLWVGGQQYAGKGINTLLAICTLQLVFIRHDAFLLNLALDIRKKVFVGAVSMILTIALMIILIPKYHLWGLCISLILGRGVLSVRYPKIVSHFLKSKKSTLFSRKQKLMSVFLILFSFKLSGYIYVDSWLKLIVYSISIGCMYLLVLFLVAMSSVQKNMFISRIKTIIPIGGH